MKVSLTTNEVTGEHVAVDERGGTLWTWEPWDHPSAQATVLQVNEELDKGIDHVDRLLSGEVQQ